MVDFPKFGHKFYFVCVEARFFLNSLTNNLDQFVLLLSFTKNQRKKLSHAVSWFLHWISHLFQFLQLDCVCEF